MIIVGKEIRVVFHGLLAVDDVWARRQLELCAKGPDRRLGLRSVRDTSVALLPAVHLLCPGLSRLLWLFAQGPNGLLLGLDLGPMAQVLDRHELALKAGVPILGLFPVAVRRRECLEPISREQASKIVLTFDVGEMEGAGRDGGGEVVVPVIVICQCQPQIISRR